MVYFLLVLFRGRRLGILGISTVDSEESIFYAFSLCLVLVGAWKHDPFTSIGALTSAALLGVGMAGKMGTLLGNSVCQYFGRISYSLYLVHVPTLSVILQGGYRLTHTERARLALGWFAPQSCRGGALAADLLHRLVEKPSMRFAPRGFKKSRPTPAEVGLPDLSDNAAAVLSLQCRYRRGQAREHCDFCRRAIAFTRGRPDMTIAVENRPAPPFPCPAARRRAR